MPPAHVFVSVHLYADDSQMYLLGIEATASVSSLVLLGTTSSLLQITGFILTLNFET